MLTQNRNLKMQSTASTNTDTQIEDQLQLLSKHTTSPRSARATRARGARAGSGPPNHTYGEEELIDSPEATPLGNNSIPDPEAHIHPDLRARTTLAPAVNMMPAAIPAPPAPAGPVSPDPAINHPVLPNHPPTVPMDLGEDPGADGRKAKRELSQSKRAAQNRAAQRAFRQRKEGYIKKLEQQVRDYVEMEHTFKTMQAENYALREYVIHLQSRLLDAQGEYPQPPPNVNLSQPPAAPGGSLSSNGAEPVSTNPAAGTPLEAVAQAVAGLAAQEQLAERHQYANKPLQADTLKEDPSRTAEELERQLRPDGLSGASPPM